MDDSHPVDMRQSLPNTVAEPDQPLVVQWSVLSHDIVQRRCRDVLSHDVGRMTLGVGLHDLRNGGVVHPRQREHLSGQPLASRRFAGHMGAQHFDGVGLPVVVQRNIDDTRATLTDLMRHAVASQAKPASATTRVFGVHISTVSNESRFTNPIRD